MNRRPRVLMIGRHFWPHGGLDSASYLVELAVGLHRRGVHVEVCTPRYATSWSERFVFREILVHRPAVAPRSDWSIGRYTRQLTLWLREHARSFDAIFVDSIREEAIAAIEATRLNDCATVVRFAGWDGFDDATWWHASRAGRRCGAIGRIADAVIAKSSKCQRTLLAEGYAASRLHRIDQGIASGRAVSSNAKREAREVLAAVNSDLVTSNGAPVVICTAPMTRTSGLNLMIKAARHLIARHPDLQLWILGDGPHRDVIYDQLRGDGLRESIAMPGTFCDIDDLFSAGDIYLQTDEIGLDYFLPAAVAREMPIVSVDCDSTRSVLDPKTTPPGNVGQFVAWMHERTAKSLRIGVNEVLENRDQWKQNAVELRRHLLRCRPQSETIDSLISLLQRTVSQKRSRTTGTSIEAIS